MATISEYFAELRKMAKWVSEAGQTFGGVAGIISFFRDIQPAAEVVLEHVAPDMATKIKRKQAQTGPDGSVDDIDFMALVDGLDDEDATNPYRPLKANIISYMEYLFQKDLQLLIAFIFVIGYEMESEQAHNFLTRLAEDYVDAGGDARSAEANEKRFNYTQLYEPFRKRESILLKAFARTAGLREKMAEWASKAKEAAKNYSEGWARDLENTGLNTRLEDFGQSGWETLSRRKAARQARRTT